MDDLLLVGERKTIGYLPLETIRNLCLCEPKTLQIVLNSMGLHTLMRRESKCRIGSGALYAYHKEQLKAFLFERISVLEPQGWPVEPEAFVEKLMSCTAKSPSLLFDLIADAFGDSSNPGRTDQKRL